MWGWLWVAALYALGMTFFHWLGGLGAAASAIQRWGHAHGESRREDVMRTLERRKRDR